MKTDSNGNKLHEQQDVYRYGSYNLPEVGWKTENFDEYVYLQCTISSFLVGGCKVKIPNLTPAEKDYYNRIHIDFILDIIEENGEAKRLLIDAKRVYYDKERPYLTLSMSAYNATKDVYLLINNEHVYDTSKGWYHFKNSRLLMYNLAKIREAGIADELTGKDGNKYIRIYIDLLAQQVTPYHTVFYGYDGSNCYSNPLEEFGFLHTTNEVCALNRCLDKMAKDLNKQDRKRSPKEKRDSTLAYANSFCTHIETIGANIGINTVKLNSIMRMCDLKI